MIIDKEQLISLLIEKTGLDREQVEDQLSELINRIQEAADEGKTFEIEGFGTFDLQDGNLQFEPSDTLETEINNKYAGMKPIELIGAFKEPEGDEIPDMTEESEEEDKVWAFDAEAAEEEVPVAEVSETKSVEAEEKSTTPETTKPEEVAGEQEEQEGEQERDVTADEIDSDEIFNEIFGSKEKEAQTDQDEQRDSKPEEPTPAEKRKKEVETEDEQQDTIGQLLVAAVIVIALGVGGWLVYDSGVLTGSNDGSTQINYSQPQQQVPAQQTNDTRNDLPQEEDSQSQKANNDGKNKDSELEQRKEVIKEGDSQAAEAKQQRTYGLRGTVNESISSSYTIVVHSLRVRQQAENRRQNLAEAGYRAVLSEANVQGTTYYRVGIGQFETVETAQDAVSEIPDSFQDSQNHFIKRIQ